MRILYTLLSASCIFMIISCNEAKLSKEVQEKNNIVFRDMLRQIDSIEKVLGNRRKEAVIFLDSLKEKDSMKYDIIVEEIERRLNSIKDKEFPTNDR